MRPSIAPGEKPARSSITCTGKASVCAGRTAAGVAGGAGLAAAGRWGATGRAGVDVEVAAWARRAMRATAARMSMGPLDGCRDFAFGGAAVAAGAAFRILRRRQVDVDETERPVGKDLAHERRRHVEDRH